MDEKTNEEQEISGQKEESKETVKSVTLSQLKTVPEKQERVNRNIDMLLDIHIPVLVELGKTEMMISEVLELSPGSIIELDSLAGEPVKITVRGKTIALGEVVVVDENFGVKISKISEQEERIKSME
ncbi:MAG: flagellar motor switch protein FliN [Candidatus Scalindua sp.]|nr:flagellar motor switch protein FliN [Candidatus Scalindua sp.]